MDYLIQGAATIRERNECSSESHFGLVHCDPNSENSELFSSNENVYSLYLQTKSQQGDLCASHALVWNMNGFLGANV